jgi:dienelactone hydrolase
VNPAALLLRAKSVLNSSNRGDSGILRMRLTAAVLLAAAMTFVTAARALEHVEISGSDTMLRGILYRPEGPGPFPAVIALHGCGGLVNSSGNVIRRYADWGHRLSAAGLAVLYPDSFSSRGLTGQCRVRARKVRSSRERVADAQAARRWLQSQPWAIKERVSVFGWADGGIASLWAVRARTHVRDNQPDFRSAVAMYPGCRRLGEAAWAARIPTLILIGRADDWTSASSCEQMVAGARGRTARTSIVVYPGAYHEFDRLDSPVRALSGLAFSADGTGHAHVGTNAAARSDALKRVQDWLMR